MDVSNRLSQITTLRFVVRSTVGSGGYGSGNGRVEVAQTNAKTITFTEAGSWKANERRQLKFNNVYRWSLDDSCDSIRLEHLRFGPDNPVYLLELVRETEHAWRSTTPHICRDDRYSATLRLEVHEIELQWTIKGPHKDESIHCWYS